MLYLTSTLPILIYFLVIKGMDGLSLVYPIRLVESFLWGVLACFICFECQASPGMEEVLKLLPLLLAFHRGRSAFLSEAVLYGTASGAGFAFLENILYVAFNDYFTLGDAIVRGFGTSLLHIGCTLLAACVAMLLCRVARRWNTVARVALSLTAWLPSIALHYLYNRFLWPEYMQMAMVILVVFFAAMLLFELDSRLVNRWLDDCISNEVSLLQSIRNGHLRDTNAGQYLLSAREHFQSEVYFDICVYLGLYLELSIAAKSQMILKEAGWETRLTDQEHLLNNDKTTELACLRKHIGKSGLLFLSPLIDTKAMDNWAIEKLL